VKSIDTTVGGRFRGGIWKGKKRDPRNRTSLEGKREKLIEAQSRRLELENGRVDFIEEEAGKKGRKRIRGGKLTPLPPKGTGRVHSSKREIGDWSAVEKSKREEEGIGNSEERKALMGRKGGGGGEFLFVF